MCLALASRHYLMDQGHIVYHGTNEEFMANDEVKDRYLALSSLAREFEGQEKK
jgi:branched-chain amino acid transport system ATP-binding protein